MAENAMAKDTFDEGEASGHETRVMNVKGAVPSGLTESILSGLEKKVEDVFQKNGTQVRVRGMRFIPSTRVDLAEGAFAVLASTVVELPGTGGTPMRPEAFDSVVTVGPAGKNDQVVKDIKIPALQRMGG